MQPSRWLLTTGFLCAVSVAARATKPLAPHDLIADGVRAAGGIDALRAIHSLRFNSSYQVANIGQGEYPGAPAPLLSDAIEASVVDHDRHGLWINNRRPQVAGALANITQIILPGRGALVLNPAGGPTSAQPRRGAVAEIDLQRTYRFSIPDRLLVEAYDAPATALRALPDRTWRGRHWSGVAVTLGADTVRFWFDGETHELAASSFATRDPIRGKLAPTEMIFTYGNWTHTGDAALPWTVVTLLDDELLMWRTISGMQINPGGLDTLFDRDSVFPLLPFPGTAPIHSVRMIAPDIFRLEGPTHAPLAVQQGDSIIVIEAPASPEFVRSMLDSLCARFPNAPVKTFVVTHHHADHIAGVPTAFDAGLAAIAPIEIADYVRGLDVTPGQQLTHPRHVTPVRDSMVVGTGPSRFVLYHVPSGHASALLMAYFPEPKLLFDIDLAAGSPEERQALYNFLRAHHLEVANLSRIHGPVLPWVNFIKTVPDTA